MNISSIREQFAVNLASEEIAENGTLEIVGASFTVKPEDQTIFGAVNEDYVRRELEWYLSLSRYVDDIPGKTPAIWEQVSSKHGRINSNYGWMVFSSENGDQFERVVDALIDDNATRQALAIYQRPSMHLDSVADGMRDFTCTNAVQYLIRGGLLHAVVQMRSNDAVFGFRNDLAWQRYVLDKLLAELQESAVPVKGIGDIIWQAGSLHVYPRHFKLVEQYSETGVFDGAM